MMRKLSLVFILLLYISFKGFSITRTASVSGPWNNSGTWGGAIPGNNDDVIIGTNITVTITAAVGGFTFQTLTINNGGILDLGTFGNTFSILNFQNTGIGGNGKIMATAPGGTCNYPTISSANNFGTAAGTGSGTVEFYGASSYLLPNQPIVNTYQNLIISGAGTKTTQITLSVMRDLTINAGADLMVNHDITFNNTSLDQVISGSGTWSNSVAAKIIMAKVGGRKLIDVNVNIVTQGITWSSAGIIELQNSTTLTIVSTGGAFTNISATNYIQTGNTSFLVYQSSSAAAYAITYPIGNITNGYTPLLVAGTGAWPANAASQLKLRSEPFGGTINCARNQLELDLVSLSLSNINMQFNTGFIGSPGSVTIGCGLLAPGQVITGTYFGSNGTGSVGSIIGTWHCYNPLSMINPSNTTVCEGSSAIFSSTPSGGTGSQTYQWRKASSNIAGATAIPYSFSALLADAGNYDLVYTEAFTFCSNTTATATLTVNPLPSITATTPASKCGSGTVALSATASTGGVIDWYTASSGGASINTGTTFATPNISTTTTYYVEATATGCASPSRTAVTATIDPIPASPAAGSDSPVCVGGTLNLTATNVAGVAYSWTGPNAFTSALQNPSRSGLVSADAGTYSVTVTSIATGCVSAAGTVAVLVNTCGKTFTGSSTALWDDPNSWSPVGVPVGTDDVTIASDCYVQTNPGSCNNIIVNAGITLTVDGYLLTISGNLTGTGDVVLTTGPSILQINGDNTSSGSFSAGVGLVRYAGSGANQVVRGGISYYHLEISALGAAALSNNISVDGDLFLTAGTFNAGSNNISLRGNWIQNTGFSFNAGTGAVNFIGANSPQLIGGSAASVSFNTLNINKDGFTDVVLRPILI
jgi:hypothetical protein